MMRTVHVAAAVIKSDRGILACRRADTQGDGGWEFPGGKVEEGESAEAACRREIAEELGCRLQLAWPYDVIETDYSDFHLVMDCFACTLEPGERPVATPGVHSELRWVDRDQLMDVGWLPADRTLAQSLGMNWDAAFGAEFL